LNFLNQIKPKNIKIAQYFTEFVFDVKYENQPHVDQFIQYFNNNYFILTATAEQLNFFFVKIGFCSDKKKFTLEINTLYLLQR
jgi:hypothetical protein